MMETSDWISLGALILSGFAVFYSREANRRANKKEERESYLNLAITFEVKSKLGIPKFDITVCIHNIGNAKAVISRIFITEKLKDGNYRFPEQFKIPVDSQRIILPGDSVPYRFEIQGQHINDLDGKLGDKTSFIRVLEATGRHFDSPR